MILFNAYACDPEKGSEPGLGWNWVSFVGRHYPVHLLTADRGRNHVLLEAIASDPELKGNVTVHFIPWELPQGHLQGVLLQYFQPYYYRFYRNWMDRSYQYAKQQCHSGKVRLVHQNTYHSFREPGDFWRLPIPSIWAPVAGTSNIPWRLLPSLGLLEGTRHMTRNIINNGHKKLNRRFRRAVTGYSKVVAGSDEAASLIRIFRPDVTVIPGQLIKRSVEQGTPKRVEQNHAPLRLVFCGLHFSRKGGGYLIKAFAEASKHCNLHLEMIGEGLLTPKWMDMATKLQCQKQITWHGRVERARVIEIMHTADAFIFPSINDCYPTVVAEALACGLPVITTDVPGVGDMVDPTCGVKVSAISEKAIVSGLHEAIVSLATNRNHLTELKAGASKQVERFQFEEKMKKLLVIYEELLS